MWVVNTNYRAVIISRPLVEKAITRQNGLLRNPRDTIGPGRLELSDAVEVDGGVTRQIVLNQELRDAVSRGRTGASYIGPVCTSTLSPWSMRRGGPGEVPLIRIIFLLKPSGAP